MQRTASPYNRQVNQGMEVTSGMEDEGDTSRETGIATTPLEGEDETISNDADRREDEARDEAA